MANPSFNPSEYLDTMPDGEQRHPKEVAKRLQLVFSREEEERGRDIILDTPYGAALKSGRILSKRRARKALADIGVSEYLSTRAKNVEANKGEITSAWPETVHLVKAGFTKGRTLGYIPEELTDEEIDDRLSSVVIQLRDPLLTESSIGYYDLEEDYVTLQVKDPADKLRVLVHELRHRISGGTFKKTGGLIQRERAGFQSPNKKEGGLHNNRFDEAVNEHITTSLINGNWDVMDPTKRKDGGYWLERYVLSSLIDKSGGLIDIKTITRAGFEDTTPEGGVVRRREMMQQFLSAYQPGTIKRFETGLRMINKYCDKYHELPKNQLDFIVPPVFDEAGKVISKGYLDLELLDKLTRYKPIHGEPLL